MSYFVWVMPRGKFRCNEPRLVGELRECHRCAIMMQPPLKTQFENKKKTKIYGIDGGVHYSLQLETGPRCLLEKDGIKVLFAQFARR